MRRVVVRFQLASHHYAARLRKKRKDKTILIHTGTGFEFHFEILSLQNMNRPITILFNFDWSIQIRENDHFKPCARTNLIVVDADDWLTVNGGDLVVYSLEGQTHQLLDDWSLALKLRPLKGET